MGHYSDSADKLERIADRIEHSMPEAAALIRKGAANQREFEKLLEK